jgi:hypothetical protein
LSPSVDASDPATPAGLATLWHAVSLTHAMLATRRQYFLVTDTEVRLGEQLSLLPLLQDWVPATAYEAKELTAMLRSYLSVAEGEDNESQVDRAAGTVSYCVRVMTMTRARGASA